MATYGGGFVQGGNSLLNPKYTTYTDVINFTSGNLNTNLGLTFRRVCGPQMIIMKYRNGAPIEPTWAFSIRGGSNAASSEVLPMFPNTIKNYSNVINYVPDETPSRGCVLSVLPQPTNTTRIDVFRVIESVTGANFQFIFAWSPFGGTVPPIITLPAPQIALFNIEMTLIYYRTPPDITTSGIASSFGAPEYFTESFQTPFLSVAGVNPLDAGTPLPFRRYNGQQRIVFLNTTTSFYFAFEIAYGIIEQGNGYFGYTSPTTNAVLVENSIPENCTITNTGIRSPSLVSVLQYTVVALDGRTYLFTFDPNPYTQTQPTIRLIAGLPFGVENVTIQNFHLYFGSV
jgi:hypothetical protein